MLSEAEREEITQEAARYPERRAACIEALKIVQRHRGFVADEALAEVAALLGMSTAELDGVATFYNQILRCPVGRHLLHLCDGVMCWMQGEPALRAHLQAQHALQAGVTSADGRVTLLNTPCLGLCHQAPAALVDGEPETGLTPERLDVLLARLP